MKEKIRLLHIQETIGYGGVERRRLSLAKHLDKDIFELKIICTQAYGEFSNEFKKHNVSITEIGILKSPFDWKQHKKVQKIIAEYKPHIIHGAVFEGVTMAAINGFLKKVPIVIIEETSDPKNRSWKGNMLMKFFALLSDKVVGVSPAAVDYLENKLKINPSKVKLINNGVAFPRKVAESEILELRKNFNISNDDIIIGSIGRMLDDENKRFSDLIKAINILKGQYSNIKLVLVGDGPERPKYENLAKELNCQDIIIFIGYDSDTAKYYSIFDIFTLASTHESFGLVLVEAMFHKLPIVATRVGGIKYIVHDKQTGFLIEPKNVDEIVSKLKILIQNNELRKKMGEDGFIIALENYTEKRYVQDVQNLYIDLCKSKKLL